MAEYLKFTRDRDYRHKSNAVTAYKRDMVVYVPDHIAKAVLADGSAVKVNKPERRKRGE